MFSKIAKRIFSTPNERTIKSYTNIDPQYDDFIDFLKDIRSDFMRKKNIFENKTTRFYDFIMQTSLIVCKFLNLTGNFFFTLLFFLSTILIYFSPTQTK